MQKRQSRTTLHIKRVEALFEAVRQAVPYAAATSWMSALEKDARDAKPGWCGRFDAWLLGQEQAGGMPAVVAMQLRREAEACLSTVVRIEPVLFCVLWTLLVTLTTLGWQSALVGRVQGVVGCVVIALTGVIWAQRRDWLAVSGLGKVRWLGYGIKVAWASASAIAIGVLAPGLFAAFATLGAFQLFEHEQRAFTAAPSGFPWIRSFARREFGVDVVMAAPRAIWARTTFMTIGTSPAFMGTGNDLCELSISHESVLNSFAIRSVGDTDLWVQGIMVHELAHCLDVRRDFAGRGGAWTATHSIAPVDRPGVEDGPGHYRIASERHSTQLWREALADMMAVGYWRLSGASGDWKTMAASLRNKRQASQSNDTTHATMCWIDLAANAASPTSMHALFVWADTLRSEGRCNVTGI